MRKLEEDKRLFYKSFITFQIYDDYDMLFDTFGYLCQINKVICKLSEKYIYEFNKCKVVYYIPKVKFKLTIFI